MKPLISILIGAGLAFATMPLAKAENYPQLVSRLGAGASFHSDVEQLLLAKLNAFRASKGLPRLVADGAFTRAARAHAMDMASRNYLGHVSADGLDFADRMKALQGGRIAFVAMGENAAMMYPPHGAAAVAETLFQSWLNSAPHLHNMQKPDFTKVATGVVFLNGKAYADQIFTGARLAR